MVGSFCTVISILDPHSLIWQRKNSRPYLKVAVPTGQANYVEREHLFPKVSAGDIGRDEAFISPVMVVPWHAS